MWAIVLAAWLSAAACAVAAARHLKRLALHAPPAPDEVRSRLAASRDEAQRAEWLLDLRERQLDAGRALSLATLVPRSMARVALASGTALALTGLAKGLPLRGLELVFAAGASFTAGVVGMVVCAGLGRQARERAAEMRSSWKRVSRVIDGEWTQAKSSG
jgi:hypothetical protein